MKKIIGVLMLIAALALLFCGVVIETGSFSDALVVFGNIVLLSTAIMLFFLFLWGANHLLNK